MKRITPIIIIALVAFVLSGFTPFDNPGIENDTANGGLGVGLGADSGDFVDVNLNTLGNDLIAGEYWTPVVDFSASTKWYFDPDASAGGDGSLENPFQSLSVEITADDKIQRYNEFGTLLNSGAVIAPGDVCVLLAGDHGEIDLTGYRHVTDHIGVVSVPKYAATFDQFITYTSSWIYADGLKSNRNLRSAFTTPGTGDDDAPAFVSVRTNSLALGNVIINNFDIASADSSTWNGWSAADYRTNAPDGIYAESMHNITVQNTRVSGVNHGIRFISCENSLAVGNIVDGIGGDGFTASSDSNQCTANIFTNHIAVNDGVDFSNHNDFVQFYGATEGSIVSGNMIMASTGIPGDESGQSQGILFSGGPHDTGTVENNIIIGGGLSIEIDSAGGPAVNCVVANNTLLPILSPSTADNYGGAVRSFDTATSLVFANNICRIVETTTGVTETSNYEYSYTPATIGLESFAVDTAPLTWDLRPSQYSPLIFAGSSTYAPATDYAGTARPVGLYDDIGAYEAEQFDRSSPAYPTGLAATAGDGTVDLAWTASADSDVDHEDLYRGSSIGTLALFAEDVTTGYDDGTVTNDSTYYYAITATDSTGNVSDYSAVASATPVQPPLEWSSFAINGLIGGSGPTTPTSWVLHNASASDSSSFDYSITHGMEMEGFNTYDLTANLPHDATNGARGRANVSDSWAVDIYGERKDVVLVRFNLNHSSFAGAEIDSAKVTWMDRYGGIDLSTAGDYMAICGATTSVLDDCVDGTDYAATHTTYDGTSNWSSALSGFTGLSQVGTVIQLNQNFPSNTTYEADVTDLVRDIIDAGTSGVFVFQGVQASGASVFYIQDFDASITSRRPVLKVWGRT